MQQVQQAITITLGVISIITIVFYAGYNFRTLQALRKTVHELAGWKQGLFDLMDLRYIRKDIFEERMSTMEEKVDETKNKVNDIHGMISTRKLTRQ